MSIENFVNTWKKLLQSEKKSKQMQVFVSTMSRTLEDASRQVDERAKKNQEERERGAHITKHRISL